MSYHRDFPSEMSRPISIVIKSYESRMIFFNQSKRYCFTLQLWNFWLKSSFISEVFTFSCSFIGLMLFCFNMPDNISHEIWSWAIPTKLRYVRRIFISHILVYMNCFILGKTMEGCYFHNNVWRQLYVFLYKIFLTIVYLYPKVMFLLIFFYMWYPVIE